MLKLEEAVKVLAAHPAVTSAWHFGSSQHGRARADSDIDVALLTTRDLTLEERVRLQIDLEDALEHDRVDVVLLNRANPVLQFEALKGTNILCKDRGRQAEFASLASRLYEGAMVIIKRELAARRGRSTLPPAPSSA